MRDESDSKTARDEPGRDIDVTGGEIHIRLTQSALEQEIARLQGRESRDPWRLIDAAENAIRFLEEDGAAQNSLHILKLLTEHTRAMQGRADEMKRDAQRFRALRADVKEFGYIDDSWNLEHEPDAFDRYADEIRSRRGIE